MRDNSKRSVLESQINYILKKISQYESSDISAYELSHILLHECKDALNFLSNFPVLEILKSLDEEKIEDANGTIKIEIPTDSISSIKEILDNFEDSVESPILVAEFMYFGEKGKFLCYGSGHIPREIYTEGRDTQEDIVRLVKSYNDGFLPGLQDSKEKCNFFIIECKDWKPLTVFLK